ncbi:MAG: winged helix-turn-helix transcriptional regulator, partial [Bacteroidota bacterium]
MNTKPEREEQLVLELLDAVGKSSHLSQRHLASNMGIALGLANSYLKRCIRKGFIKISEAPANR